MPKANEKNLAKAKRFMDGGLALYASARKAHVSPPAFKKFLGVQRTKPAKGKYQAIMIADPIDDKITLSAKQLAQFVKEFHRG